MLKIWGMQTASSLPSLPGPLSPGVVGPDKVLSVGQIELNSVYNEHDLGHKMTLDGLICHKITQSVRFLPKETEYKFEFGQHLFLFF